MFNGLPGGGTSAAVTFTVNNPAPTLASLSQNSALVGAAAITLNVTGTNFVATSVVDWNGTPLTTTFSSATLLIATVPVGDLTTAGTAAVTVVNAAPGGGTSTAVTFTINNTLPTLVTLSQTSAIAGAAGFSLTVTGTNFVSGSTVDWNGAPLVTTFTSATQLIAAVPMADIATGGTATITIVTPAPGGGTSARSFYDQQSRRRLSARSRKLPQSRAPRLSRSQSLELISTPAQWSNGMEWHSSPHSPAPLS